MQVYLGVAGGCKKRDGSARELREVATSTRQLVMVREKKAAAPTWRSLLGWTLAAGEFRHPHYPASSVAQSGPGAQAVEVGLGRALARLGRGRRSRSPVADTLRLCACRMPIPTYGSHSVVGCVCQMLRCDLLERSNVDLVS